MPKRHLKSTLPITLNKRSRLQAFFFLAQNTSLGFSKSTATTLCCYEIKGGTGAQTSGILKKHNCLSMSRFQKIVNTE
jgi:hypothetical protein